MLVNGYGALAIPSGIQTSATNVSETFLNFFSMNHISLLKVLFVVFVLLL